MAVVRLKQAMKMHLAESEMPALTNRFAQQGHTSSGSSPA